MTSEVRKGIFWALSLYGILSAFALAIILIETFLLAYLTPEKMIVVTVNQSNEANIELWLIMFTVVCWIIMAARIPAIVKKLRGVL